MKTIDNDIKRQEFKKVYLLYGEERYLIKQYRDKLKKALISPDDTMNYSSFEGEDLNVKEIIDLAETLPFFADKRVILVEGSKLFKKGGDELGEYLADLPETTYFIFVEEEVDKRSKLFKAVGKCGNAIEFGEWVAAMDSYIGIEGLQEDTYIGKSGDPYTFTVRKFIGEYM